MLTYYVYVLKYILKKYAFIIYHIQILEQMLSEATADNEGKCVPEELT